MKTQVFLFLGEEEFLKEEEINKLIKSYDSGTKERPRIICHKFWADDEEFAIEKVLAIAKTANLFSCHQIIVIRETEKINPSAQKALLSYIQNPVDSTILILVSQAKRGRMKQKDVTAGDFLRTLSRQPRLVVRNCSRLSEWELRQRIKTWAKERGKVINERGIDFLLSRLGRDIRRLYQTIEKLSVFAKDKEKLEDSDLENIVDQELSWDVYKMLDAVLTRNTPQALEILRQLNQFNVKPEEILSVLAKELRKIYRAKKFIRQGLSPLQIRTKLGIKFYADKLFAYAKNLKFEELEDRLRKLLYADVCIKTGRLKSYYALESWILELAWIVKNN
jgi:DNA polymerase-3 subunit delta